jgi:hypothetical protein
VQTIRLVLLIKWGILKAAAGLHQTVASTSSTLLLLCLPARGGEARNILYSNAACTNADQPGRVLAFVRRWQGGRRPSGDACSLPPATSRDANA